MHLLHSFVGWAGLASVLATATAYQCDKQEDHQKAEMTINGKIYRLYCNSQIDPMKDLQRFKNGISTPEECVTLCATRAEGDCEHALYSYKRQSCNLRAKPTSIQGGSLLSGVAANGALYSWVYDRDAPQVPPPVDSGGQNQGSQTPINGNSGSTGGSTGGNTGGSTGGGTGGSSPSTGSSGNLPSYDCTNNKDDGKYFTENGVTLQLLCNTANPSSGYLTQKVASLKDCAALCAQDTMCGSAEFHVGNSNCEIEPDSVFRATPGYHLWIPKACPQKPRALAAIANPAQTSDLSCPDNDGKVYEGKDGSWYYIQCCSDSSGALIRDILKTGNHEECVNQCTSSKECLSVSFDTTASNHNCKLYGPGGYSIAHVPGIHHLYATSPPTFDADHFGSQRCATECPAADGQIFASPTGENFIMSCQKRHGTTYLKQVPDRYPSFPSCIKACAATPACLSVDFEPKTQNCYFSTNSKNPSIQAPAFMSAHSAGCSGACAGCNSTSCADLNSAPLKLETYSCPNDNGKGITVDNVDFTIACRHAISSAFAQVPATSHTECVTSCAASSDCEGVNWFQASKGCFHHKGSQPSGSPGTIAQSVDSDAFLKVQGKLLGALTSANIP